MLDPGCFVAIIKRKEMMQFDSLFMIKVAESKGLFGDPAKERNPKQKAEVTPAARQMSRTNRRGRKRAKVHSYSIQMPSHSYIKHDNANVSSVFCKISFFRRGFWMSY